jgi:hypothetical protein
MKKEKPPSPESDPLPEKNPRISPPAVPEEPVVPGGEPGERPEENPGENQPAEIPAPGRDKLQ